MNIKYTKTFGPVPHGPLLLIYRLMFGPDGVLKRLLSLFCIRFIILSTISMLSFAKTCL